MNHRRQVLLVEDNEGNEGEVKRWLRNEYQVEVARSLAEAKTRLLNSHYHVLIVDINLDEDHERNKDGYRLMEGDVAAPATRRPAYACGEHSYFLG